MAKRNERKAADIDGLYIPYSYKVCIAILEDIMKMINN